MEDFLGTYTWEKSENWDAALQAFGTPLDLRKVLNGGQATIIIKDLGDGKYRLSSHYPMKAYVINFKLGEETKMDAFTAVTMTLNDGVLLETKTFPQYSKEIVKEAFVREGDLLTLTIRNSVAPNVSAKVTYKKQQT